MTEQRKIWSIFYEVDQGELSILETKYDFYLTEFKQRYHDEYNPLEGRKNSISAGCDMDLHLTVEGISYDKPENQEGIVDWKLLDYVVLVLISLVIASPLILIVYLFETIVDSIFNLFLK